MRLGSKLRALRTDLAWSQEKVAIEVGISLQHLSNLENGFSDRAKGTPANPRLAVLVRLAQVLGTTPDALIDELGQAQDRDVSISNSP